MITVVRPISLSLLTKLEHRSIMNEIIEMLTCFDLKSLHLQSGLEMLLKFLPQLEKLEETFGKHPLSNEVKNYNERRLELAGVISTHLQVLQRAKIEFQREDVEIAKFPIRLSLLGIRKDNQVSITERINYFFIVIKNDPTISAALTRLGFQIYLDELYESNRIFEELKAERVSSISKRHTKESKAIQAECQALLRHLFEQIELTQNIYKDQDYSLLLKTLNIILAKFTKGIKRRATYNKKRAKVAAEKAEQAKQITLQLSVNGNEPSSETGEKKSRESNVVAEKRMKEKKTKNVTARLKKRSVHVKHRKPLPKSDEERADKPTFMEGKSLKGI